jgi:hypothetical protein
MVRRPGKKLIAFIARVPEGPQDTGISGLASVWAATGKLSTVAVESEELTAGHGTRKLDPAAL